MNMLSVATKTSQTVCLTATNLYYNPQHLPPFHRWGWQAIHVASWNKPMVAFVEVVPSVLRSHRVELSTGGVDPLRKISVTIGGLPVYALRLNAFSEYAN